MNEPVAPWTTLARTIPPFVGCLSLFPDFECGALDNPDLMLVPAANDKPTWGPDT